MHSNRRQEQTDTSCIVVVSVALDVSTARQSGYRNAHRGPAYAHMLGQFRQSRWARCMQMVENAGLVFRDRFPAFVLTQMLTMAGEKDRRIGIPETSDL